MIKMLVFKRLNINVVYLVAFFPKAGAKIRQKTLYAFDAFDAKLIRQQFGIKKGGAW
ncbi:MAG: hypothetical protein IIV71_04030 [Bacteroidaceae bacterium]|nr:hypothetical protein [Bacteroidaceae bacterium]MBQ5838634.1 hypothetical protein [Bacteroidaceae bacterium]